MRTDTQQPKRSTATLHEVLIDGRVVGRYFVRRQARAAANARRRIGIDRTLEIRRRMVRFVD